MQSKSSKLVIALVVLGIGAALWFVSKNQDKVHAPKEAKSNLAPGAEIEHSYHFEEIEKMTQKDQLHLLLSQIEVETVMKDQKPIGYKILTLKDGSIYDRMGLKPKDVIKKINGRLAVDEEKNRHDLSEIQEKKKKEVSIVYERNGNDVFLQYFIQ